MAVVNLNRNARSKLELKWQETPSSITDETQLSRSIKNIMNKYEERDIPKRVSPFKRKHTNDQNDRNKFSKNNKYTTTSIENKVPSNYVDFINFSNT